MSPEGESPIVIAIDGTSASGKSTNARLVAKALGFVYVNSGAMYRTLAWYCLDRKTDITDAAKVATACRRWHTSLKCVNDEAYLLVNGYYPEKEIRSSETSAAVAHVAAYPKVREWMKHKLRDCLQFGSVVMEGRDIGSNVFPETEFKFYLDASPDERAKRRAAEGITEDLAQRDQRDSQRKADPLMVPLGAIVINNSDQTAQETSAYIIAQVKHRMSSDHSIRTP